MDLPPDERTYVLSHITITCVTDACGEKKFFSDHRGEDKGRRQRERDRGIEHSVTQIEDEKEILANVRLATEVEFRRMKRKPR